MLKIEKKRIKVYGKRKGEMREGTSIEQWRILGMCRDKVRMRKERNSCLQVWDFVERDKEEF